MTARNNNNNNNPKAIFKISLYFTGQLVPIGRQAVAANY
jgi:hypothetical protein